MTAPTEPRPFPGAPEYFRRLYVPPEPAEGVVYLVDEPLLIYGIGRTSDYAEDRALEREAWRDSQVFMAWCWSPLCPEGEPGLIRLADVSPITADEFAAARDAGWPQAPSSAGSSSS
jgi:hypothetical protein